MLLIIDYGDLNYMLQRMKHYSYNISSRENTENTERSSQKYQQQRLFASTDVIFNGRYF